MPTASEIMAQALGRGKANFGAASPSDPSAFRVDSARQGASGSGMNFNFSPSPGGTSTGAAQPPADAAPNSATAVMQKALGIQSPPPSGAPPLNNLNIGFPLNKIPPAETPSGVMAKNIATLPAQAVNVPGALATGAAKTYLPALWGLRKLEIPGFVKKGVGEVAEGLKGLYGVAKEAVGPRQDFMQPGPDIESVPHETLGESVSPDKTYSSGRGLRSLQGAGNVVGGAFNALGAGELMEKSAKSFREMAPRVPQTPSVGWNVAGGTFPVLGETVTEGLAAAAPLERVALGALRGGKAVAGKFVAPVVDAQKIAKEIAELPTRASVEETRAQITGRSDFNPAFATPEDLVKPKEYPVGTLTNHDLKQMSGMTSAQMDQFMADKVKRIRATATDDIPTAPEGGAQALDAERQAFLDGIASQSRDLQESMGLKYGDDVGIFDRVFNPTASPRIAPAVEQVNRTTEVVADMTERFQNIRKEIMDLLKKPGRLGVWGRDKIAEQRVSKALDGKFDVSMLKGNEFEAYKLSRGLLDKLADMEGLKGTYKHLSDYFPHMKPKDAMLAEKFRKQGFLYDPMTGSLVRPSESVFHKTRQGMKEYSYDLNDVLAMRINTGVRKTYLDPVIWDLQSKLATLPEDMKGYMGAWIDRVQGRTGVVEHAMDKIAATLFDKPLFYKLASKANNPLTKWITTSLVKAGLPGSSRRAASLVNKAFYRYMLGLALDTAAKNTLQSLNVAGATSTKNWIKGYGGLLTSRGRKAMEESGALKDLMAIQEHQYDTMNSSGIMKKLDNFLFSPMQATEYINRTIAYNAGLAEAAEVLAKKGFKDPPWWMLDRYAKAKVLDPTQFKYGPANINPYFNNPLGKLVYQFATYPANQVNFMRALLNNKQDWLTLKGANGQEVKLPLKLLRLFAVQGAVLMGAKELLDIDLKDSMGWTDKPFGVESPVPLPGIGQLHALGSRLPGTNILTGDPAMTSPAVTALSQLRGDKGKDMLKAGLLGLARVPGRAIGKYDKYLEEEKIGKVRSQTTGKPQYKLKEGEAGKRFFGLRPGSQVDFEKRMEAKRERSKERRQKTKEALDARY